MKKVILITVLSLVLLSCSDDEPINDNDLAKSFLDKYGGTMWVHEYGEGYEFTFSKDAPIIYWEGCNNATFTPIGKTWIFEKNSLTERYTWNGHKYRRSYTIKNNNLTKIRTRDGIVELEQVFPKTTLAEICN